MSIIQTVVVESNMVRSRLLMLSPLVLIHRVSTEGSSKRLFSFLHNRQGALADGLHGLNPRNTALFTPESKRRPALIERLVKQLVHGGNKASCISESIRQAHLGLFGFSNVNRSK